MELNNIKQEEIKKKKEYEERRDYYRKSVYQKMQ